MWGTTKVVGATRGPGEAGEVGDEGMTQVLAVRPPKVVVGPLAFVRGGGGSDHPPLFRGWFDHLGSRSDCPDV
jgi:hypothetical protein